MIYNFFPGSGVFLQNKLGWSERHIPCYDIRQQCSGFIYGLQMAQAFIETGMYENILLMGAEVHSHGLEFNNRGRAVTVLFGDGAACAVISKAVNDKSMILRTRVHADGSGALNGVHAVIFDVGKKPMIYYNPFDETQNQVLYPEMPNPKNLFTNAVRRMTEVALSELEKLGLSVADFEIQF